MVVVVRMVTIVRVVVVVAVVVAVVMRTMKRGMFCLLVV